tara:strand:+ start:265 stop:471 length:207 start_codon:yes stop_codon:yes gene_type:complete
MRNTEQLDVTPTHEPMPYEQMVSELAEFDAARVSVAEAMAVYENARDAYYSSLSYADLSEKWLNAFWS